MTAFQHNFTHDKDVDYPQGYTATGDHLGLKHKKKDSALLVAHDTMNLAGVFSSNSFRSVSIDDAIHKIKKPIKALAVFSGNANTCTGAAGKQTVDVLANGIATALNQQQKKSTPKKLIAEDIILSFTGVIGMPFPFQQIAKKIPLLVKALFTTKKDTLKEKKFYDAILTTDTHSKKIALETQIDGKSVRFAGCAKGAGMVYPNMATMLSFVTTDLDIDKKSLNDIVKFCVSETFNVISIDGATSTNDSFFLIANGASGVQYNATKHKKQVIAIVKEMALYLAKAIVLDAEGATKFVTIKITCASTTQRAKIAASAVANSLLVKTALYGSDPNYGRILCALGASGLNLKIGFITLSFGYNSNSQNKVDVFKQNTLQEHSLKKAKALLQHKHIDIYIDLGEHGNKSLTFYTADISQDYVHFNSLYTS